MVRIILGLILAGLSGVYIWFGDPPMGLYGMLGVGLVLIVWGIIALATGGRSTGSSHTSSGSGSSYSSSGSYSKSATTCRTCKYYETDVDLPYPVCTLHRFHFEGDYSPCEDYT